MAESRFTATYSNGVFKPAVPLDIEDGSTVVLSVADSPSSNQNADLFKASAGSWADLVDGEKLIDEIRELRIANSRHEPFRRSILNYLVDSDWAIHYLRGAQPVIDRLQPLTHQGVGISIISVAELYHGVFRSRNPQRAEENLNGFLSRTHRCRIEPRCLQTLWTRASQVATPTHTRS